MSWLNSNSYCEYTSNIMESKSIDEDLNCIFPLKSYKPEEDYSINLEDYMLNSTRPASISESSIQKPQKRCFFDVVSRDDDKQSIYHGSVSTNMCLSSETADSKQEKQDLKNRMRAKKEKTKKLLDMKRERSDKHHENDTILLSRREAKMLRNRIAAQRSRDRIKKHYKDLEVKNKELLDENSRLRDELDRRDLEISNLKKNLCETCKGKDLLGSYYIGIGRNSPRNTQISLMAGFIVVICLFGSLSFMSRAKGKAEGGQNLAGLLEAPSKRALFSTYSDSSNTQLDLVRQRKRLFEVYQDYSLQMDSDTQPEDITASTKPDSIIMDDREETQRKILK